MKKLTFLLAFILFITYITVAQKINPPAGFTLVKANGTTSHIDHYEKDGVTFMSDAFTGPLPSNKFKFDKEVAGFLSENYRTSLEIDLHFSNGVYYGTAFYSNQYFFTVLDYDIVYKISSRNDDVNFKNYSDWLLAEVKSKGKLSKRY